MNRKNKIGRLAEKKVSEWATQADCVINSSIEDDNGWDMLIEFPLQFVGEDGNKLPFDMVPPQIKCWIQVKATDNKEKSIPIKLSNWIKLVKCYEPVFFCVLEFDGEDEPQRGYLIYLGETYIDKVFKKLRTLSLKKDVKLNKHRMSFSYSSREQFFPLNGKSLHRIIMEYVPNMSDYFDWKRKLLQSVGYDDESSIIDLTIKMPEDSQDILDYLVRFSLGQEPYLTSVDFRVSDRRYGLELPEPTIHLSEEGLVKLVDRQPDGSGILKFRTADLLDSVQFNIDVFAPNIFGFKLPEKYQRLRMTAPFLELIFSPKQQIFENLKIEWPSREQEHELKALFRIAKLICLLHEAKKHQKSLKSELIIKGKVMTGKSVSFPKNMPPYLISEADLVVRMQQVCAYFDLQNVKISIAKVQELSFQILFAFASIFRQEMPLKLKFCILHDSQFDPLKAVSSFLIESISFGGELLIIGAFFQGLPIETQIADDRGRYWEVHSNQLMLFKSAKIPQKADTELNIRKQFLSEMIQKFEDQFTIIVPEHLKKYLEE